MSKRFHHKNRYIEQIETECLILKAMKEKDAKALLSTVGDSETAWWSDDYIYDLDETIEFIEFNNQGIDTLLYGVFRKESDDVIGYVQIKLSPITGKIDVRELGYAISKEYRRQGYMSEAVNAVCNHLFQNEYIKFITLEILPDNLPSLGVARKCGFSFVEEPEEKKHLRFLDDNPLYLYVRERMPIASDNVSTHEPLAAYRLIQCNLMQK